MHGKDKKKKRKKPNTSEVKRESMADWTKNQINGLFFCNILHPKVTGLPDVLREMTQYYTSKALHMWLEKILWENMHSNYIFNIQKYLAFFQ